VRSESDGGDQTRGDRRLRAALTGGPGRQVRVHEAVPAVRAVRSKSDGGDQTRGDGRLRSALLLSAAVRSPELRLAQARGVRGRRS
jgi:hypothetical protein